MTDTPASSFARMRQVLLAAALVVGGGALVLLNVEPADERPRVVTRAIVPRTFQATVDASGIVRPRESVDISAEVVGRLLEAAVGPGDAVAPGQIVALIDDATQRPIVEEHRAMLREAETALAGARIDEEDAKREHDRARELHAEGIVSARRVEETQVALDRAANGRARAFQSIERARSALRRAEQDLERTVVRSPIRGAVLSVDLEPGELVVASSRNLPGSKIMTLGADAELVVEADISEVDVVRVEEGQPVEVTLAALGDGVAIRGEVVEIQQVGQRTERRGFGNAASGAEFLARIRLLDPPRTARPSMTAQVRIETERRDHVLAVPAGALVRRFEDDGARSAASAASLGAVGDEATGSWQVAFVVEEGRVEERLVSTGLSDLLEVEVTEGLAAGDRVVVGPPFALRRLTAGDEVVVEER